MADALSRRDTEATAKLLVLSSPSFQLFDDLRAEVAADAFLSTLMAEVLAGARGPQWKAVDGLISVAGKVYVSPTSPHLPTMGVMKVYGRRSPACV